MNQDWVLLFGVVFGILTTIAYMVFAFRRKTQPQLHHVVIFFLGSAGMGAGFKVGVLALDPEVLEALDTERLYVFIGGLSVIWVSFISLLEPFRRLLDEVPLPESSEESDPPTAVDP